ncbi:hypothetical protein RA307_10000 [Xanthobacteraceae bacterium Astr-EGSB]|uniref:hypothetical protein n=1 Tax=Astrobacterium formosum TaxID=3069710 RepID=UPI0027ADF1BB|nr:hypothetical protein [Xanthobacteraceae bacterium Astr-EGSB]
MRGVMVAAVLVASIVGAAAEERFGRWKVHRSVDKFDGLARVVASTAQGGAMLAARCIGKMPGLAIGVRLQRSALRSGDAIKLRLRVDDGRVFDLQAFHLGNDAFQVAQRIEVWEALERGKVAAVRVIGDGEVVDLDFGLDGAAAAIDRVRAACFR